MEASHPEWFMDIEYLMIRPCKDKTDSRKKTEGLRIFMKKLHNEKLNEDEL